MVADRLDHDEKDVSQIDTLGGKQNLTVISEAGLYNVILRSDKPEAKAFKRWVTHEVLPTIRKHGAYMTPEKIEEVLLNPDTIITLARQLKQANEEKARLAVDLHEKAIQLDESREWLTIKRVAALNARSWKAFDWKRLKNTSRYMELPVRKVFDPNLGQVNAYHITVWRQEYGGCRFS
jgi:prophage antirepressor-like protein